MYVAQVGVASIFLSGSGQLYVRSVEQLYSVPTMAIDYLFQAGYKETSGSLTCSPTQVCTLLQASYVLVDIIYHFNCLIVGCNPKLKKDEWRWQDEGRCHENG